MCLVTPSSRFVNQYTDQNVIVDNDTPADRFFQQRLDHFDPQHANVTFRQRYFVNDAYFGRGDQQRQSQGHDKSPIFLYVGGESELRASAVTRGHLVEVARRYGGLIVALEHRYYGVSRPFERLSPDNLRWLTSQQALQDLAAFIEWSEREKLPYARHGSATAEEQNARTQTVKQTSAQSLMRHPWIVVGGSYPGNLAAWFRLKFPHLATAVWSSSAPVRAKSDYFEYDMVVAAQLGEQCADSVRRATRQLERQLFNDAEGHGDIVDASMDRRAADRVKNLFHPRMATEVTDDVSFLYVLADVVAYAVQYDNPGVGLREKLCGTVSSSSDVDGDTMDNSVTSNPDLLHLANFTRYFFDTMRTAPREMDVTHYDKETYDDPSESVRQWMYQCCAEFGYWQSAPHKRRTDHDSDSSESTNTRSLRSRYITEQWHMDNVCGKLYGFASDYRVPVDMVNAVYGERAIVNSTERIIFLNGDRDPWAVLGVAGVPVAAKHTTATSMYRNWSEASTSAGNGHNGDEDVSYLIPGVGHCSDLGASRPDDPIALTHVREMITAQIGQWLSS